MYPSFQKLPSQERHAPRPSPPSTFTSPAHAPGALAEAEARARESVRVARGRAAPQGAVLSHNRWVPSPSNVSLRESRKRTRATSRSSEGLGGGQGEKGAAFPRACAARPRAVPRVGSALRSVFAHLPRTALSFSPPPVSGTGPQLGEKLNKAEVLGSSTLSRAMMETFPTALSDPAGPGGCAAALFSLGIAEAKVPLPAAWAGGGRRAARVPLARGSPLGHHSDRDRAS